jgi:hypothetical protein
MKQLSPDLSLKNMMSLYLGLGRRQDALKRVNQSLRYLREKRPNFFNRYGVLELDQLFTAGLMGDEYYNFSCWAFPDYFLRETVRSKVDFPKIPLKKRELVFKLSPERQEALSWSSMLYLDGLSLFSAWKRYGSRGKYSAFSLMHPNGSINELLKESYYAQQREPRYPALLYELPECMHERALVLASSPRPSHDEGYNDWLIGHLTKVHSLFREVTEHIFQNFDHKKYFVEDLNKNK